MSLKTKLIEFAPKVYRVYLGDSLIGFIAYNESKGKYISYNSIGDKIGSHNTLELALKRVEK